MSSRLLMRRPASFGTRTTWLCCSRASEMRSDSLQSCQNDLASLACHYIPRRLGWFRSDDLIAPKATRISAPSTFSASLTSGEVPQDELRREGTLVCDEANGQGPVHPHATPIPRVVSLAPTRSAGSAAQDPDAEAQGPLRVLRHDVELPGACEASPRGASHLENI